MPTERWVGGETNDGESVRGAEGRRDVWWEEERASRLRWSPGRPGELGSPGQFYIRGLSRDRDAAD